MLPSVSEWNHTAREMGFDISIDESDLTTHSGYLPVKFEGHDSGFEYYMEASSSSALFDSIASQKNRVVQFVTFSDEREAQCALVCALALLSVANGIYFDSEGGSCSDAQVLAQQAREWIEN